MKFTVKTKVGQSFINVKNGFNDDLLSRLSPPFPKVTLKRYDGSKPGDIVSLELNFFLFKQTWTSKIVAESEIEGEYYFIDEGVKLPHGLVFWRHKHLIKQLSNGTEIQDIVEFKSYNDILTFMIYPFILSQFIYRKPLYKRIFGKN
ncbi:SRPBCC family protein [Roseivirga spongicola]|jgi:ligand-binding SRPBCC domain-containing protein|uniref:SRPBCC family protein n=1 Tax=Roseivirga spongicola TaxID=333140 RepID=UPI002AC9597E|nr:hypothetical protein [Roseivirga spongicola]WPZ11762.1 hypothetical protein T7867_06530 [Roseivirga spongicola]